MQTLYPSTSTKHSINPIKSHLKVEKDELILNIEKLKKNAIIWQKTGGTHVAAFVNNEKNEFIVREDVSRHVAVDKVIGAAKRKNLDFSNSYIIYSGRMPADMVIKIVRSGIPLLVQMQHHHIQDIVLRKKEMLH